MADPDSNPFVVSDPDCNLLFANNVNDHPTKVCITFHHPKGNAPDVEIYEVPALRSHREPLQAPPRRGKHVLLDQPRGFSVAADDPVVCEVWGAEFEMWSQVSPGAMSAVMLYPGPLTDETTLGVGTN